ncbi:hypothetical protein NKH72_24195 [Mesorhizobium sp. M0955]|uniref:hypothetical protein n=1 Tax=Mesorhizobium sp. M0955 TaxID=2957033 RepID=UPI00333D4CAF
MSANTRQLVFFVSFAAVWSLAAGMMLDGRVHPLAVFFVWIVGFVWGVGYIAAGKMDADLLLKRWLQMMAGAICIGWVGSLLFS